MCDTDFDIVVIGGGLAGASLACALAHTPLRIAVIEAVPLAVQSQPSYDERRVALALGSQRILQGIGVWGAISTREATAIKRIHISDRGYPGKVRLSGADVGVSALGYVVPTRVIGASLLEFMQQRGNISLLSPASVTQVEIEAGAASVKFNVEGVERKLSCRLAVVADGGRSNVRTLVGIRAQTKDYCQTAVVSTITAERYHCGTAYERFTRTGPLALLPMSGKRYAVVWTVRPQQVEHMLSSPEPDFLGDIQQAFGDLAGQFTRVGGRAAYSLSMTRVANPVRPRVAVIGNAAHTVHPVAGQGFNLGLRDVAALAEVLAESVARGRDLGDLNVLTEYAAWRKRDTLAVTVFTDGLARIFSNGIPPVAMARDLGLAAVDLCPPIKRALLRRTMGLAGRLPRLALGTSL
ncbi:MAG: 2-octaprenyl-6-methoxyphenyl hydroxylase [Gammaproteobacteria bacterium]|nr:2-octaprenyl-6-methoxyphenyl hydroxylase [Gammaproteobacteria bacterium]